MSFLINILIGTATGILTGFGIGGGTLLIICMTNFGGISQLTAQGINLLYFLPTAGASLIGHIKNKFVDRHAFIWTASAGIIATTFSSIMTGWIDVFMMRKIFGIFLLVIGVRELFRKV